MHKVKAFGVLVKLDFASLELRSLAAACLFRQKKSTLAETYRKGRDPHSYSAAMIFARP